MMYGFQMPYLGGMMMPGGFGFPPPRFPVAAGFGAGVHSPYLGAIIQRALSQIPQTGGRAPAAIPSLAGFLDPLSSLQAAAAGRFSPVANTSTGDNRPTPNPKKPPAHRPMELNRWMAERSGGGRQLPQYR